MCDTPISTQWPFDTITDVQGKTVVPSVVLVVVRSTLKKGTGWLVSPNDIVTNEHVVQGAQSPEDVSVTFPDSNTYSPNSIVRDPLTDIAALTFDLPFSANPLSINTNCIDVGSRIFTWGHPLGYSGPAPILSVGYLAGYNTWQLQELESPQQRLVLNAALNPGNSGGPIFLWGEESVCGVGVTKHAPISHFLQSAIQALANNRSGVCFSATDGQGISQQFVESQLVANVLSYFRDMTQVVIGEAIMPVDLINFLNNHNISWTEAQHPHGDVD